MQQQSGHSLGPMGSVPANQITTEQIQKFFLHCLQDPTLGIRARLSAMATTSTTSNANQYHEGQSTQRPPLFDGTNYNYWKCRMKIYLQSINYEIWNMTETEYTAPTIPYAQWNDDMKNQTMNNAKAMNALFCALTKEEFNRVSNATTTHLIWHTLEVTHEGTNKVKESKISVLVHRFEMFRMKENESVSEMITRFTDITNSLVALGKIYTQAEMVRKVLRALTLEWEKKITAIEEANGLSQFFLENLVGNLMAYEVQIEERKKDAKPQQSKKKTLAFKAMSDSEDEEEDEEIAMFTRRFKKFLRKGKFNSKFKDSNDPLTCFRCNKVGHMKDCPLENTKSKGKTSNFKKDKYTKNKFAKNKKAYQATWDDNDSSSEEEIDETNEVANVCFMASQNQYLDENKQLILAILDNQNSGKLGECAQYQAQLQKNLLYLAAIADAQPQVPAVRPQMIPQAGMPQVGVPYMQQAPIFPPKGPVQFTQQVQELQQQQLQHHQPHMMQFPGHMGMRPINAMNSMHAAMHTELSHARGNNESGNAPNSAPNSSVDGLGNKQDGVGALEQTDSYKNSSAEHGSGDAEPKRPEDAKSP